MLEIGAFVAQSLSHPLVRFVLALLIGNLVTGLVVALIPKKGTEPFRLGEVGAFMLRALGLVAGALTIQAVAYYATSDYQQIVTPVVVVTWAFVLATLVGKIIQNLRELGIPIPAVLGDKQLPETKATL